MTKTLLVLGASVHQIKVIETAMARGINVHVADNQLTNPGHQIADVSHNIDTTSVEQLVDLALELRIDGVIAPCTDVAVPTAAIIAKQLGMAGISPDAAKTLTSKLRFRQFQSDQSLDHPEFLVVENTKDSQQWQGRCILKPDHSSGSKGVVITDPLNHSFSDQLEVAKKFSGNGRALIEEFIDGHQGTLEGVFLDGRTELAFFLDRQVADPPNVCTYGHRVPSKLSPLARQSVVRQVEKVWQLLNIDNVVFDVDFVWDGERVFLLEMSPRLGGNSISGLIQLSTGVDLASIAIDLALGQKPTLHKVESEQHAAVVLLGVSESGVLSIDQAQRRFIEQLEWAHNFTLYANQNQLVEPFTNGRHCLARTFISAESSEELRQREQSIRNIPLLQVHDK